MPVRSLRRVVLGPLWIVLAVVMVVLAPLLGLVALIAAALTRNRQPLRLVHFVLLYQLREAATLLACAWLWLASGFGRRIGSERFQIAHYRLLGWLLAGILRPVLRSLNIGVDADASQGAAAALSARDRPLILFSRHAGPGDSFLIINLLLERYDRRPRIVMKEALAIDPCLDLLCHRLPNALLDTAEREECERKIAALSDTLDGRSVLVLFPEGGNYTPERRRRAIMKLWRKGRGTEAARAERMQHVMPPKTTGALAALGAQPAADVIFAAHTGLGHEAFPLEMWRNPPTDRTVRMRMWLSPAAERPAERDGQADWLFAWWQRLDDWIALEGREDG